MKSTMKRRTSPKLPMATIDRIDIAGRPAISIDKAPHAETLVRTGGRRAATPPVNSPGLVRRRPVDCRFKPGWTGLLRRSLAQIADPLLVLLLI